MKQWIIDRYNKGQNTYIFNLKDGILSAECLKGKWRNGQWDNVDWNSFLYCKQWGFAKAFWGTDWSGNNHSVTEADFHTMEMAISDNPLKYLEQFKDAA